ncbi:MlrC C-terminal domain-containing protein [Thermomicrobium sp. 4228-Ro]|uniref:MlrC C-terminal domain-containing protein n=1 Tax=Thermomicrobium sp. 4228-Ro TaxID=2993937 RepID=UPI00224925F2|nr:MlrC C-terminal domain-containing protein [Thermomicrobium sp. 4228-Ro]MCX2726040.1 MlrC C-terminal domain-containing protein [Thermomicrobium sp. 4228-Ro]
MMRIGIVVFDYRTNTFAATSGTVSLLPADTFDPRTLFGIDSAAISASNLEVIPLLTLSPAAGGPLPRSTFDTVLETLDRAIEAAWPLDALLLVSSGTALTDGSSGEVALARFCRTRYPHLILSAYFDHTAQFPEELLGFVPLISGPHTWPARDRPTRVRQLFALLHDWHAGEVEPVAQQLRVPSLLPLVTQRTDCAPLDRLPDMLALLEAEPAVLCATLFAGFPYADVEFAGARLVVVSNRALGDTGMPLTDLADTFLELLRDIPQPSLTIEEALHAAMGDSRRPILILDTGDAPEAGAPGEGTAALWAALDLGAHGALLVGIVDPEAVGSALSAGVGRAIELELGGKRDHRHGYPIPVHGRVRGLVPESLSIESPRYPGLPIGVGPSAWLELEGRHEARVDVIVTTRPVPFADLRLPRALGCELQNAPYLIVKSALDIYLNAEVQRFGRIIPALTPGITSTDLAFFDYRRVPRPIWPLDNS